MSIIGDLEQLGLGDRRRLREVGTLHPDAPVIVVRGDVIDGLIAYSNCDLRREQGAFLLGLHHTGSREVVAIRHFLPAAATRPASGSLTFTHDTWATLRREMEQRYPDEQLLGWHHTHPGLGIFLSPYDQFLHRQVFHEPWQVALVVDPRRREFGFFQWHRGALVDCGFVLASEEAVVLQNPSLP